jgi:glycosyltransferase 2 family protein
MFRKARAIKLFRVVVTLSVLALLWRTVDGPGAMDLLLAANPVWLLAAVLVLNAQTVLSALRWRLTARGLGQSIPVGRAVREYYLSQIVNQSLPGGVVGDAGRAVRARHEAGLKRAGQAVVFERLAGQLALFGVTGAAVLLVWISPGGTGLPAWVLRLVAMTGGALLVGGLVLWAVSRRTHVWGHHVREWFDAFAVSVLAPDVLPRQIILSLATTALNLLAFALCARATGTGLPLTAVMIIVPLILLTMLIPISVSGWGLREGAAAALFPVIGATATEGFAASFAFGLMFLVSVLPGVVFLLIHPRPQSA